MTDFFEGVQDVYCAQFMLTVSHNCNSVINYIMYRDKMK